jgi:hypothetical protein
MSWSIAYNETRKTYHVRTIEAFTDITNILKDILPQDQPSKEIYITVDQTYETYKWNYITRKFDLLYNTATSTTNSPYW